MEGREINEGIINMSGKSIGLIQNLIGLADQFSRFFRSVLLECKREIMCSQRVLKENNILGLVGKQSISF
jgi:hypothetical protein